jgi:hypothetical protein
MKYFNELTAKEQDTALEKICGTGDLPLFDIHAKEGTRALLKDSRSFAFDDRLNCYPVVKD